MKVSLQPEDLLIKPISYSMNREYEQVINRAGQIQWALTITPYKFYNRYYGK